MERLKRGSFLLSMHVEDFRERTLQRGGSAGPYIPCVDRTEEEVMCSRSGDGWQGELGGGAAEMDGK